MVSGYGRQGHGAHGLCQSAAPVPQGGNLFVVKLLFVMSFVNAPLALLATVLLLLPTIRWASPRNKATSLTVSACQPKENGGKWRVGVSVDVGANQKKMMEAAKRVAAATIKPAADKDVTFIALQSKDLYPPLYLPLIIPGRRTNVCCLCMPVSSALLLAIQIETVD